MSDGDSESRRRFLHIAGTTAVVSVAGCGGGPGDGGDGGGAGGDGNGLGPVPSEYETATAQGGQTRNPESLSSKSAVSYQSEPNDGQQCSNCSLYVTDENDDGLGACAIVEGTIEPDGYCVSYVEHDE